MKNKRNRLFTNGLFYIVIFLLMLWGINWMIGGGQSASSSENVSYSQFVKNLKNGKSKTLVFSLQMVFIAFLVLIKRPKCKRKRQLVMIF